MAFSSLAMVTAMAMLCIWVPGGDAATDCSTTLASLEGCSTFLTNPSSTPDDKSCCQPLKSVLSSPASFQCICAQATSSSGSALFKNALSLPKACKLDINVSEANCTSTSTSTTSATTPASSTPSTTPATPKTATPTGTGSGGFISASPYLPLIAVVLLYPITSLFLL